MMVQFVGQETIYRSVLFPHSATLIFIYHLQFLNFKRTFFLELADFLKIYSLFKFNLLFGDVTASFLLF